MTDSSLGQYVVVVLVVVIALGACFVLGITAVAGYFIWRQRYRGSGHDDLRPTDEVFRDPSSGKLSRVWEDPSTGHREYREESRG